MIFPPTTFLRYLIVEEEVNEGPRFNQLFLDLMVTKSHTKGTDIQLVYHDIPNTMNDKSHFQFSVFSTRAME